MLLSFLTRRFSQNLKFGVALPLVGHGCDRPASHLTSVIGLTPMVEANPSTVSPRSFRKSRTRSLNESCNSGVVMDILSFIERGIVKHLNCLSSSGVVCKILMELFCDAPGFHIVRVHAEVTSYRRRLLFCGNTMPKLNLAQVSLIHVGSSSNYPQRHILFFTHLPQPFTKSLCRRSVTSLFWSSHLLARYNMAG